MVSASVTCYDEREISSPATHLHSDALNHCGRSCADRLASAGRSDTTEDKLGKKMKSPLLEGYVCVYLHRHPMPREAGRQAFPRKSSSASTAAPWPLSHLSHG